MARDESIKTAIDAIGDDASSDWNINPTKHADVYATVAPTLSEALSMQNILDTASQYHESDQRAAHIQADFKSTARRANVAVFITACAGAAITVAGSLMTRTDLNGGTNSTEVAPGGWIFIALGLAGLAASSLASMWFVRLRNGHKLQNWMESRAEAERRRIEYFSRIIDSTGPADTDFELLKLEYFRRYLLGSQLKYYDQRGTQHENSARRTLDVSTASTTVAAVLTGIAGLLAASFGQSYSALAGIGVMITAFGAMFSAREGLNQDTRNAQRYSATRNKLLDIRKKYLEQVRKDTANGVLKTRSDFVAAVGEVLLEEHSQWLESAKLHNAAIDGLEKRLREATAGTSRES